METTDKCASTDAAETSRNSAGATAKRSVTSARQKARDVTDQLVEKVQANPKLGIFTGIAAAVIATASVAIPLLRARTKVPADPKAKRRAAPKLSLPKAR